MVKTLLTMTLSAGLFACATTTPTTVAATAPQCQERPKFRASGSVLPWGGTQHPHIRPPVVIIGIADKHEETDLRGALAANLEHPTKKKDCPKLR